MRMQILTVALLAATAGTSSADPVKANGHELDFTRPAKFQAAENTEKGVWVGEYTSKDPEQQVVFSVIPHKLEDGPSDLAKLIPKLDAQLDAAGLKPDNAATKVEADGFNALSHHYISKDPKKAAWGMSAVVHAGAFSVVVFATAFSKPDDLTKLTLATLASIKVDGKKGPAPYKK